MKGWILSALNEKFTNVLFEELSEKHSDAEVRVLNRSPLSVEFVLKNALYRKFLNPKVVRLALDQKYPEYEIDKDYKYEVI